jgi:hypothetical protein
MDGAYLMDKIRSRCIECGDCLLWQGAGADKTPCMRLPGQRALVSVRRVVLQIAGTWKPGQLATNTCGTSACVGVEHAIGVTRKALVKQAVARTAYHKRPTRNAKISAIARAGGRLSPEAVEDIRASDLSTRALAARHGVAQSTVWELVSGKTYRDYAPSPFSGLGGRRP